MNATKYFEKKEHKYNRCQKEKVNKVVIESTDVINELGGENCVNIRKDNSTTRLTNLKKKKKEEEHEDEQHRRSALGKDEKNNISCGEKKLMQ